MNRISLVGNLTHDIKIKSTKKGDIAIFQLACEEYPHKAEFINCHLYKKKVQLLNHVEKGALMAVNGVLKIKRIKKKNGNIIFYSYVYCDTVSIL